MERGYFQSWEKEGNLAVIGSKNLHNSTDYAYFLKYATKKVAVVCSLLIILLVPMACLAGEASQTKSKKAKVIKHNQAKKRIGMIKRIRRFALTLLEKIATALLPRKLLSYRIWFLPLEQSLIQQGSKKSPFGSNQN
jgi:hypothetical protein